MAPYSAMMGIQQQNPGQNNAEQMRRQQIESVGMQIRQLTSELDSIAKQFPVAAQEVLAMKSGLTKVLVKIVGSSAPESQPSTGALG
jgi:hypothetical protein